MFPYLLLASDYRSRRRVSRHFGLINPDSGDLMRRRAGVVGGGMFAQDAVVDRLVLQRKLRALRVDVCVFCLCF